MSFGFWPSASPAQRHELDLEAALVAGDTRTRLFDEQALPRNIERMDRIKSIASRVMHHEFYKWFYVVISGLSIFALITSYWHKCDSSLYLIFEFALNGAMIIEVSIRIAALQAHFWTSWSNLFDIFVVATCIVTILLMPAECSDAELRLDAVVLIVRNIVQATRLFSVINQGRKHSQIQTQPLDIDFNAPTRASPMLPSKLFAAKR